MKPTPVVLLLAIAIVSGIAGHTCADLIASRGEAVPVPGYPTAVVLLLLAGVVLYFGLQVKRYLDESRERSEKPSLAPRQHHLDMMKAYRIVTLARAAAYTGAVAAGFAGGIGIMLLVDGGGTWIGAGMPIGTCVVSAVCLSVVGVLVQLWGRVDPPDDQREGAGDGVAESL